LLAIEGATEAGTMEVNFCHGRKRFGGVAILVGRKCKPRGKRGEKHRKEEREN